MLVEAQALKRLTQDDVLCDVIRRLLREAALRQNQTQLIFLCCRWTDNNK